MLTTAEILWALEQTAEGLTKSIKSTEGEGETGWETADRFQSRMEMTREFNVHVGKTVIEDYEIEAITMVDARNIFLNGEPSQPYQTDEAIDWVDVAQWEEEKDESV